MTSESGSNIPGQSSPADVPDSVENQSPAENNRDSADDNFNGGAVSNHETSAHDEHSETPSNEGGSAAANEKPSSPSSTPPSLTNPAEPEPSEANPSTDLSSSREGLKHATEGSSSPEIPSPDDCHVLGRLIWEIGKKAIRTRLECSLSGPYERFLADSKAALAANLPESMVSMFYVDGKSVDGKPKPLSELSLRNLIMLCLTSDALKSHFTNDDKIHMAALNDSLMRLYWFHQQPSGNGSTAAQIVFQNSSNNQQRQPLKDTVKDSLIGIGISAREVDDFIMNPKNRIVDEAQAERSSGEEKTSTIWNELEEDPIFYAAFLKQIRKLNESNQQSSSAESMKTFLADIEHARKKDEVELDSMPNIAKSVKKPLEAYAECAISKEAMVQPKTLPCLHSFSAAALKKIVNLTDKTVTCPTCNTRVSAPDERAIDSLPASFVINSLLSLQKKLKSGKIGDLECALCIHFGTFFCLQSGNLFCKEHRAPLYHRGDELLIPVTDLLDPDRVNRFIYGYCAQHRMQLEQFCTSCQVPLCGNSACITWHAQHGPLKALSDVRAEHRSEIRHLGNLLNKKQDILKAKIGVAETNQLHVADLQENIRNSIQKYFDDMQKQLQDRKEEFIRDLDKAAELCWHQDEHSRQALSKWSEKASNLLTELDENRNEDNDGVNGGGDSGGGGVSHGLSPRAGACNLVTSLAAQRRELLQLLADTVGGTTLSESKALSYPEGQLRTMLQSITNLKSNITSVNGARGWEIVAKPNGLKYFLVNRNSMYVIKKAMFAGSIVWMYDLRDFTAQATLFTESGVHEYQAIGLNADGQLLLPEEVQSSLELPAMKLKKTVNITPISVNKEKCPNISSDCLNTYNKILFKTALTDANRTTKMFLGDDQCICEMDAKGTVIRKFDFYTMLNISDFCPEPERDLLLVTDATRHNLMIFNCKQQQMMTVGGQGATPGQFFHPSGVCVDSFGHVFVADGGNSRVQIFDMEGKFVKFLQYPQSLRDLTTTPSTPSMATVQLQAYQDYLYMADSRLATVFRIKYT